MTATQAIIEIETIGLTKSYGDVQACSDVSVVLRQGITVLLGRNGAGKSTLCRLLAGAEAPDAGSLRRAGQPIDSNDAMRAHKSSSGWMPQGIRANGQLTVRKYVEYAGWLKGMHGSELSIRAHEALLACNVSDLASRRLSQLSGGMLRRVCLAQSLVHHPKFLVLDEPTTGLDPEQRGSIHRLLKKLGADHCVLLSTHLLEDVVALADRLVVLDRGAIVFEGSFEDFVPGTARRDDRSVDALRASFLRLVASDDFDA